MQPVLPQGVSILNTFWGINALQPPTLYFVYIGSFSVVHYFSLIYCLPQVLYRIYECRDHIVNDVPYIIMTSNPYPYGLDVKERPYVQIQLRDAALFI